MPGIQNEEMEVSVGDVLSDIRRVLQEQKSHGLDSLSDVVTSLHEYFEKARRSSQAVENLGFTSYLKAERKRWKDGRTGNIAERHRNHRLIQKAARDSDPVRRQLSYLDFNRSYMLQLMKEDFDEMTAHSYIKQKYCVKEA